MKLKDEFSEPIDEAHRISMIITAQIREGIQELHNKVADWEPASYPEDQTSVR